MATSHGSKGNGRNGEDRLWEAFAAPSDAARPHTFWHWMNGNVTKEGITADLEAMANAGMGGVYLYMVEGKLTESLPVYVDRPVRILTPEWFAMMRHAAEECKRLGLELSLMNCTGWSTSGGPWVPPEKSMMRIAWSETYHKGPGRIAGSLPLPPCDYACYQNLTKPYPHIHESVPPEKRFYRDMAVLAYRLDPSAAKAAALWPPKVSCSEPDQNPAHAIDGDGSTAVGVETGGFVRFEFPEPVVARGVEYLGDGCELQASDDGSNWSKVADLPGPRAWGFPQTLPVPETKARYFQLRFSGDACMRHLKLSGDSLVQDYGPKAAFHGLWVDSKVAEDRIGPPTPPWAAATIRSNDILDLTDRLRADGTLDWEAPEGEWMIVRLGCAPIGRLNAPCAREFAGLECNKLDPEAVALHFDAYTGRVADELEDLIGTGFHYGYVDSWEAGDLNFTPQFIEEFKKRRGYNPVPFLLVHGGGRVVDSPAIADRFLWDVRRTIGDLIADYYFSKLNDLCHARGLKFGIYQVPVDQTCAQYFDSYPGSTGSQGHEAADARQFAAWGVDYLKYDWCSPNGSIDDQVRTFAKMRDALAATGRPIVYSINPNSIHAKTGPQRNWGDVANMWRTTEDITNKWDTGQTNGYPMGIQNIVNVTVPLASYARPGSFNDPDMMEVGRGGMNDTEMRSHFALWTVLASPLIAGNDIRSMDTATQAILKNRNLIAINQDSLGLQATQVSFDGTRRVLAKKLANGDVAVALFNQGSNTTTISTSAAAIGKSGGSFVLTDAWTGTTTSTGGSISASVPAHGTVVYRVSSSGTGTTTTTTTGTITRTTTTTTTSTTGGTGGCSASYVLASSWPGGYVANVIVTTGSAGTRGWRVTMTLPSGTAVSNGWNASFSGSTGSVTATNASYNGTLGAGQTTSFGFQGTGSGSGVTVSCTAS